MTKSHWLRSEIEKLEEVKEKQIEHKAGCPHTFNKRKRCDCGAKINEKINTALTSIITRYKEELLEFEKKV